jgi:hypothetical protein
MLHSEIYDHPTQELMEYWAYQQYWCEDRNKHWFDALLINPQYLRYWVLRDSENEIAAFSCIQTHGFPEYTCRINTRTFIDPEYRDKSNHKSAHNLNTPMFQMTREQYEWLRDNTDYENCFVSMENGRTAALQVSARKFTRHYGIQAEVLPYRYKMFDNTTHPSCYQQVLLFPIKTNRFDLDWIIA